MRRILRALLIPAGGLLISKKTPLLAETHEQEEESIRTLFENIFPSNPKELLNYLRKINYDSTIPPDFSEIDTNIDKVGEIGIIDGLQFNISYKPNTYSHIINSWHFLNRAHPQYSLYTSYLPRGNTTEQEYIGAKYTNEGKLELKSSFEVQENTYFKVAANFPSRNMSRSDVNMQVKKYFDEGYYAFGHRNGAFTFSHLQTLCDNIFAGFEAKYNTKNKRTLFQYGLQLFHNEHRFYINYNETNILNPFGMAYVYKPNQRLALFNQYKGDLLLGTGNSLFGFRLRFKNGQIVGTLKTPFKCASEISHFIDDSILFKVYGEVDFWKEQNNALFGASVTIGAI